MKKQSGDGCYVICRSGGIGRRTGLKILRELNPVPVRFRFPAPYRTNFNEFWNLFFFKDKLVLENILC